MTLINVPQAALLNEMALRLFFDAWSRIVSIFEDFSTSFEHDHHPADGEHDFSDEWAEYVGQAQNELASVVTVVQHAAELRLKSIICEVSPYLLLLNSAVSLSFSDADIDFVEQRTLDAVDLPGAVKKLTSFLLPSSYPEKYNKLRQLRNKFTHLGTQEGNLTPRQIAETICQQYTVLWPDGKWLARRTKYDGNSARRFFHDGRYSSVEDIVMEEMSLTKELMDNATFKICFGSSKSKIDGCCPNCIYSMASKIGNVPSPTVARSSKTEASCLMCNQSLTLKTVSHNEKCEQCESMLFCHADEQACCFKCGAS
jgi:hypothetical protein